jgi:hypothetical protein
MTVNKGLEDTWKENVVTYFKVIYWYMPIGTLEDHGNH